MPSLPLSRRSFLAMSALLPWAFKTAAAASSIPVGLELYSVRDALKQDPEGTVRTVAQLGYEAVEFYAPYFEWTDAQARHMRKLLDDLGVDYWKAVAEKLNSAAETLEPAGLKAGYHNHQAEFTPGGGQRPIEILAKN